MCTRLCYCQRVKYFTVTSTVFLMDITEPPRAINGHRPLITLRINSHFSVHTPETYFSYPLQMNQNNSKSTKTNYRFFIAHWPNLIFICCKLKYSTNRTVYHASLLIILKIKFSYGLYKIHMKSFSNPFLIPKQVYKVHLIFLSFFFLNVFCVFTLLSTF